MLKIGTRQVGDGAPVFLIAEVGVTHNGSPADALRLVDAAATAGADAVKFQILDPDALFSEAGKQLPYTYRTGEGQHRTGNLYQLLRSCTLPDDVWPELAERARQRDILFFGTVESGHGVEIGEQLGFPAYKICAWDLTAGPLINHVLATGKPVLLDVDPRKGDLMHAYRARVWARPDPRDLAAGEDVAALLYAPHQDPTFAEFLLTSLEHPLVGYSAPTRDETFDFEALAAGASILERRLTLDPGSRQGHHHFEALGPDEFGAWVRRCRRYDAVYGGGRHPYHRDPRTGRRPYS